ncbi:hypothetical protein FHS95_000069 [Sphingomonas naasensis]|uniref:Uncharacterized protein n=1 Tax=Sphingomonas naasensis TaxID=1344951 RepID=A0A4S1WTN8_9SPHN|nr:hypothetical protein [Sphingomonas naasensis]NIJ18400.1 hypothetical protein [Sphingomonas naasensis]TGX45667.1 hypothetical protein E5A74_00345 [Sphingomonas naasensis]
MQLPLEGDGVIGFIAAQLAELYRRGFGLFVRAPLILAIVAIPELLQHGFEIHLGMFESAARARALAADSGRWAFGYAKLAALLIAMAAAARFWHAQDGRWWDVRGVAWLRLIAAVAMFVGLSAAAASLEGRVSDAIYRTIYVAASFAVLPLLFAMIAALFGEERPTPLASLRSGWRGLPLLALLLVAAYLPTMAAHHALHRLALGRATTLIAGLMTLDTLVVGLIASCTGAAFALAYAAAYPGMARD